MKTSIMFATIFFSINAYCQAQCDTLSYFNKGNLPLNISTPKNEQSMKMYLLELDLETRFAKDQYNYWNGENTPIIKMYSGQIIDKNKKVPLDVDYNSFIGTDYFEIHFAKEYLDSAYRMELENQGKELALKYISNEPSNKKHKEYYTLLKKVKQMIPEDDFYLMLAFAERLNRNIYIMRIKSNNKNDIRFNNKFYLLLSASKMFKSVENKHYSFLPLTSDEIPENYVIQTEFELE